MLDKLYKKKTWNKIDLKNLKLVKENIRGGTSTSKLLNDDESNLYLLKEMNSIDRNYNKIDVKIDYDKIYFNEINALKKLSKYKHFPVLIDFINGPKKSLLMTYCGENLYYKKTYPDNWKEQILNIYYILEKENIYHNDIFESNFCLLDDIIYLIDFGESSNRIDYPYFNLSLDLINNSDSIEDMCAKIRDIGLAVIATSYIRSKKFFNE